MFGKNVDIRSEFSEIRSAIAGLTEQIGLLSSRLSSISGGVDFLRRRTAAYLGDGVALTYLDDETPIYINSLDFGPSANFLNGGEYETDNLDVILSFARGDSIFLDIGANLGYFSLQMARRVRSRGKVYSFEPHPDLIQLLRASSFLNGFGQLTGTGGIIEAIQCGLGDENAEVTFGYPIGHLAGGGLLTGEAENVQKVNTAIRRADDYFPEDFTFDLAKIDVEGHELGVLRGMESILSRSRDAVIIFEKLGVGHGYEQGVEDLFSKHGYDLYVVNSGAILEPIAPGKLTDVNGYAVATRIKDIRLDRRFFNVYPCQLSAPGAFIEANGSISAEGAAGSLLFHGPYWFLRRGAYEVEIFGDIDGEVDIALAHRFGMIISTKTFSCDSKSQRFIADQDLLYFELVGRAKGAHAKIVVERIEVRRVG